MQRARSRCPTVRCSLDVRQRECTAARRCGEQRAGTDLARHGDVEVPSLEGNGLGGGLLMRGEEIEHPAAGDDHVIEVELESLEADEQGWIESHLDSVSYTHLT